MALWILNRPAVLSDPTELRVAELLARLPDDWVIRWGFYYQDNNGQPREGDFLVLGPEGGLLVLEVKADISHHYAATGRWETRDGDHPLYQLDSQWKAVVNTVNRKRGACPSLFVSRAIALPKLEVATNIPYYHDIPRHMIFSAQELRDFVPAWQARFTGGGIELHEKSREIFFHTYGQDITPRAIRHFVDETDRALMRHTETTFELLDQLSENRQFMVRGGTGTGKTWMAFENACRWAEAGPDGSSVLFLCYNRALTHFLQELAAKAKARGRPVKGSLTVMSWEQLARQLLARSGIAFEVPASDTDRLRFYTETLPGLMAKVVSDPAFVPPYDALVVDEAQDHDTGMAPFPADWQGPGWWGVYWRLLKEGRRARVAMYYDPAQRPVFRDLEAFDDLPILQALQSNPVRIGLNRTVRYSRPIFHFLKSLRSSALAPLVDNLHLRGLLPEGPPIERYQESPPDVPARVEKIVQAWLEHGLCRPEEILVLSLHGSAGKSSLAGLALLAGYPLVDYLHRKPGAISFSSVNKAKGLDSLAVILVDFPPAEQFSTDAIQLGFFMGASRARQILAIVFTAA